MGERLAVVRAAGAIVRQDVAADESLRNAPPRGDEHNYGEELAMLVKPVRQALAGYAATLVRLLQSVSFMPLQRDVVGGGPSSRDSLGGYGMKGGDNELSQKEEEARAPRRAS